MVLAAAPVASVAAPVVWVATLVVLAAAPVVLAALVPPPHPLHLPPDHVLGALW